MDLTGFAFTVLVSVIAAAVTSLLHWRRVEADLKKEYQNRFNQKKWEIYTRYVKHVGTSLVKASDHEKGYTDKQELTEIVGMVHKELEISGHFLVP